MIPPRQRYDRPAMALHWLLALLILANLTLGLCMADLPLTPWRLKLFNWHKWAGMTILMLSALRVIWRVGHRPPPHLPMPAWQERAAQATHGALYLLFFALPLAGWAYSSAAGFPVVLYGLLPLPDWVPVSRPLAAAFKLAHEVLAWALVLLIALHVGAALKHHFIDRDALLRRMWPTRA